jgi:phage gp36-like protein
MTLPPYANGSDLVSRYDVRLLGDYCSDTGVRVSPANVPTDPNVITALTDAASAINSACQIGERYTQAQLAALTGADKGLLYRLCCDLAFCYLCQRRGVKPLAYEESYKRSEELLVRLKNGELIFNVPGNVAVGVPGDEFPSSSTYATVNLLRDAASPLFPLRRRQQPASGGFDGPYGAN